MDQQIETKEAKNPQDAFLKKWSWGGFLTAHIWAIGSRMYLAGILILIFSFIPVIPLGYGIYYGIKGRQKAWSTGKWTDFEAFKKRQLLLDNIGFGLFLLSIVYFVVSALMAK